MIHSKTCRLGWIVTPLVRKVTPVPSFINVLFTDILSSSSSSSSDTKEPNAIINARRLYSSCIDEEAIETDGVVALISFINTQFGGWPILQGSAWDNSTFNFVHLLLKMNEYGNKIIYGLGTGIDDKNSSVYSIQVK